MNRKQLIARIEAMTKHITLVAEACDVDSFPDEKIREGIEMALDDLAEIALFAGIKPTQEIGVS